MKTAIIEIITMIVVAIIWVSIVAAVAFAVGRIFA